MSSAKVVRKSRGQKGDGAEYFLGHLKYTTLKPLLYWYYESIPAKYTKAYFTYLQWFVYTEHELLVLRTGLSHRLYYATELSLRILVADPFSVDNKVGFHTWDTIRAALLQYSSFFKEIEFGHTYDHERLLDPFVTISSDEMIGQVITDLQRLSDIDVQQNEFSDNARLVSYDLEIYRYIQKIRNQGIYLDLDQSVMDKFRKFIGPIIGTVVGYEIPPSDSEEFEIIGKKCKRYWKIKKN